MKPISRLSPFTLLATGLVFGIVFGSAQHFKAVSGEALHTLTFLGLAVAYLLVFTAWFWGAVAEDAKPLLEPLPGETRFNYALALEGFSASARMSLRLNSVFYMSALLYPDDHKPGQPDNLTLCIDRMEKMGLDFRTE